MCMMLVMLPFFMLAMYEKHGQPLEKIVGNIIKVAVIRPKERPYKTNNFMPFWNGRKNSTRRCMTLFTAIKSWLHRLFGKRRKRPRSRLIRKR